MAQFGFASLEADIKAIVARIEAGSTEIELGIATIEAGVEARITGCRAGTDAFEAGVAKVEADMAKLKADAQRLLDKLAKFVKAEKARMREAKRARERWEAGRAWYTFPNGLGCIAEDTFGNEDEVDEGGGTVGVGVSTL